jgi:hypothetical protein
MKMKNKIFFIIALFGILTCVNSQAEILVETQIDTNNVLIGEPLTVTETLTTDKKIHFIWPEFKDSTEKVEILKDGVVDTVLNGKQTKFIRKTQITAYDTGSFAINPLVYVIEKNKENDFNPIVKSLPLVRFHYMPLDSTAEIIDIKAPIQEPITLAEIINYIAIVLSIIIIAFLLYSLIKNYKPAEKVVLKYDPTIPAHILAAKQLKELEDGKLWQNEQHKEFYIKLSEIIRLYIERRFGINALEMTSNEIKAELKNVDINEDIRLRFEKMLDDGDLTKFAKFKPLPDENFAAIKVCYDFVEFTKVLAEENNIEEVKNNSE